MGCTVVHFVQWITCDFLPKRHTAVLKIFLGNLRNKIFTIVIWHVFLCHLDAHFGVVNWSVFWSFWSHCYFCVIVCVCGWVLLCQMATWRRTFLANPETETEASGPALTLSSKTSVAAKLWSRRLVWRTKSHIRFDFKHNPKSHRATNLRWFISFMNKQASKISHHRRINKSHHWQNM